MSVTPELPWPPSNVEEYIAERLIKHSILSANDLLVHSDVSLSHLLGISATSCRELILKVRGCRRIVDTLNIRALSTGVSSLDCELLGGFQPGWLVEIFGEAGSGKTQWCFSIVAHMLNMGERVIWIDSENSFRPERILEIVGQSEDKLDLLSVCKCNSIEALLEMTTEIANMNPAIVVIDSIAALARNYSSGKQSLMKRQELIHKFAVLTKKHFLESVVICTNHVMADFKNVSIKPALGNTWSHDVTCRIWIKMEPEGNYPRKRYIELQKSPTCCQLTVPITITPHGVVDA